MLIASDLLRTELEASDWRLQALVTDAVRIAGLAGYHLRLTGVRRSRTRTLEIYLRAGKPAPPSSVHEATPCRGADLVPVPAATGTDAGADMAAAMAYGPSLAEAINRGWGAKDSRVFLLLQEERAKVEIKVPAADIQSVIEREG